MTRWARGVASPMLHGDIRDTAKRPSFASSTRGLRTSHSDTLLASATVQGTKDTPLRCEIAGSIRLNRRGTLPCPTTTSSGRGRQLHSPVNKSAHQVLSIKRRRCRKARHRERSEAIQSRKRWPLRLWMDSSPKRAPRDDDACLRRLDSSCQNLLGSNQTSWPDDGIG